MSQKKHALRFYFIFTLSLSEALAQIRYFDLITGLMPLISQERFFRSWLEMIGHSFFISSFPLFPTLYLFPYFLSPTSSSLSFSLTFCFEFMRTVGAGYFDLSFSSRYCQLLLTIWTAHNFRS